MVIFDEEAKPQPKAGWVHCTWCGELTLKSETLKHGTCSRDCLHQTITDIWDRDREENDA